MWYLYVGAVAGIICELARPKKYDDIALWKKLAIPAVFGLLWPIALVWLIVVLIRDR